jgi:hypothetical protein
MSCTIFEQQQVDKLALLLNAYIDAITAVLSAGVTSYTLDTGQGRQTVTRQDVGKMQEAYGLIWQQYDALSSRCNYGGAVTVTPCAW